MYHLRDEDYAEDDRYIHIDVYDILGHPGTLTAVPAYIQ